MFQSLLRTDFVHLLINSLLDILPFCVAAVSWVFCPLCFLLKWKLLISIPLLNFLTALTVSQLILLGCPGTQQHCLQIVSLLPLFPVTTDFLLLPKLTVRADKS